MDKKSFITLDPGRKGLSRTKALPFWPFVSDKGRNGCCNPDTWRPWGWRWAPWGLVFRSLRTRQAEVPPWSSLKPFLTTTETVGQTDEVFGFFQTEVALLQRKVSSKSPSARFQKRSFATAREIQTLFPKWGSQLLTQYWTVLIIPNLLLLVKQKILYLKNCLGIFFFSFKQSKRVI
jgi:hypothetical protein